MRRRFGASPRHRRLSLVKATSGRSPATIEGAAEGAGRCAPHGLVRPARGIVARSPDGGVQGGSKP
jgi:hypothetical protein